MGKKVCSKCHNGKELSLFKVESRAKDGYRSECKECAALLGQLYRKNEPWRHTWNNMKARCNTATHPAYKNYGGRGIKYCSEWASYKTFKSWCVNNGYMPGLHLDRKDNDGDYNPDNCRFVTQAVNNNNRRPQSKNTRTTQG